MTTPYYQDDLITLHHGDALAVAATIVTSPPYFGLRDYGDDAQIGADQTLQEYITSLVKLFSELSRVLARDGLLWLNLGDSYAGSWGNQGRKETRGTQRAINAPMLTPVHDGRYQSRNSGTGTIRDGEPAAKNLIGVPWRVALALQDEGWILRSEIIWHKPNPMPESVRDRPTKSHEHLFMFAKNGKYFYDAEAINEPATGDQSDRALTFARTTKEAVVPGQTTAQHRAGRKGPQSDPSRRNKRDVWTVPTVPFPGSHFAVYPPELIRPCILAGARKGDTVLDPFSGSGTTGMVATQEGRKYVGIDLNAGYLDLSLRARFQSPPLNFEGGAA
jgi:DNA modification methylase